MGNTSVSYDSAVIREFAGRLYRQAASIVITSTIFGLLFGGLLGSIAAGAAKANDAIGMAALFSAVIGGVVGFFRGTERAFKLRLEAQVALCQVQIERNTAQAITSAQPAALGSEDAFGRRGRTPTI